MPTLNKTDRREFVEIVGPRVREVSERRAYVDLAFGPSSALAMRIELEGSPNDFVLHLLRVLEDAQDEEGRPALARFLEVFREDCGEEDRRRIDEIFRHLPTSAGATARARPSGAERPETGKLVFRYEGEDLDEALRDRVALRVWVGVSRFLGLDVEEVRVESVELGSLVVTLRLPGGHFAQIDAAFLRGDPRLAAALAPYELIDVIWSPPPGCLSGRGGLLFAGLAGAIVVLGLLVLLSEPLRCQLGLPPPLCAPPPASPSPTSAASAAPTGMPTVGTPTAPAAASPTATSLRPTPRPSRTPRPTGTATNADKPTSDAKSTPRIQPRVTFVIPDPRLLPVVTLRPPTATPDIR